MPIEYNHTIPTQEQALNLYTDAEWLAYTNDSDKLMAAIHNAQDVICAFDGDTLVGLIRSVGDKTSILYIQDILVLKAYKRRGIAKQLVNLLLNQYPEVRQVVLLTDDKAETRGFYTAMGFSSADDGRLVGFCKFR